MVPIICVVGKRNAGKTYTTVKLVSELKKRGYRVATVKHSAHDFNMDQEGKDSWQHTQAGSDATVISSPHRFALIRKVDHDTTLPELSRFIGSDFDIIIAEGFKQDKAPKIEVHRKEQGPDLICRVEELLAVATDEQLESQQVEAPQYTPDDTSGLVDLIEKMYLHKEEKDDISLFVNGEPVNLNIFVHILFINTLSGMIASLKRIPHKVNSIDISIRRKDE